MSLLPIYDHLWQSTVFALLAALFTLALRGNRARVRHALWLAASIKFVLPLSVLIALGNQIQWSRVPESGFSSAVVAMSEPFTMPLTPLSPRAVPVHPAANPLYAFLLAAWAIGFLGIACSWWIRWRRIAAVVRSATPVPLPLPIPAVASPTLVEPGIFGVVRPVLLLPASIFERLTPAQWNTVIAHELYHVRHYDNLVAAFHMFVETIFWFHPLVWWIGRRVVEERELACDEAVLSTGSEPRVYAEAVLNVCKLYVEAPLACVSGITGANLKRRIEGIMTKRIVHDLHAAKKLGLAIAATAALLAPIYIGMLHSPAAKAQSPATAVALAPAPPPVEIPAQPQTAPPATAPAPKPRPPAIAPAVAMVPQVATPSPLAPEPQIDPGATPEEARKIRTAYAKANFKNGMMASAYSWYGPPTRKDRTATTEIWQYDNIDLYHGKVTIEFHPDAASGARVTWPAPSTFEANNQLDGDAKRLAAKLDRDSPSPSAVTPKTGLPGRGAYIEPSLRINRVEQFMNLMIPLDSFSGRIDVIAQVTDSYASAVANLRDSVDASAGTWQSSFVVIPGSYTCNLLVREQVTGLMYSASIPFQVSR